MQTNTNTKCNNKCENSISIDVNISDIVFTPLACAALINEILKALLHQKNQIPYPYHMLKSIVDKKRKADEHNVNSNRKINLASENHHRVVKSTYDSLQGIMKSIELELEMSKNQIKEVVILFGSIPLCPKEVITIKINDSIALGHLESNHSENSSTNQHKILRNIFLNQTWVDGIDTKSSCTNTYVFLRKSSDSNAASTFIPGKPIVIPANAKQVQFNLNAGKSEVGGTCCDVAIFRDDGSDARSVTTNLNSFDEGNTQWFQSQFVVKGFKDCFINKVSVCGL